MILSSRVIAPTFFIQTMETFLNDSHIEELEAFSYFEDLWENNLEPQDDLEAESWNWVDDVLVGVTD